MTDSQSQTRRRFLKGSIGVGGLTAVAGCGSNNSQPDGNGNGNNGGTASPTSTPVPFPATTGVEISPSDDTLQVVIWFEDPVKPALNDDNRDMTAEDLVSFDPTASEKTVLDVDSKRNDEYLTRIQAKGVVTQPTKNDADIVSTREVTLRSDIPLADSITNSNQDLIEKLFTFSVRAVTIANNGVEFPEGEQDTYEFPFRQTYSQLNSKTLATAPSAGSYSSIWENTYNSGNFPEHTFEGDLAARAVPALDHYNNRPFLSLLKFSEAKRELYTHLINLVHRHENLNAEAWQKTRKLVGEAMYAAAGVNPEKAHVDYSKDIVGLIAGTLYRGAGAAFNGVMSIAGLITAYGNIMKAGDEWTDSLMETFRKSTMKEVMSIVRDDYKQVAAFQTIEEQHILPALTLSKPSDAGRRAAHRFYDMHLDTERAALYSLFSKTDAAGEKYDWDISSFTRALLYKTDSLEPHFIDITENRGKLNGTVATPDSTSIAPISPNQASPGDSVVGVSRFAPEHIGYNDKIRMDVDGDPNENNVALTQPVGQMYRDMRIRPGTSWYHSDDPNHKPIEEDILEESMYFVHLAETIDMILNITRIQQTMLQAHTNIYRGASSMAAYSVDGSNYTATLNSADVSSRKVYTALTRSGGQQDPGTGVAYTMISTETGTFNFHKLNSAKQITPKKYVLDRDYKHSDGKVVNVLTTVTDAREVNVVRISSRYKNAGSQRVVIGNPSKNIHKGDTLVGSPWISEPSGEYRFHIAGVGSFSYENTSKWETFNPPTTDSDVPPFVTTYDDNLAISLAYLGVENDGVMVLANAKDGLNGDPVRLDYTVDNMALEPGEEHRREVAYAIHEGGENAPQKARELFKQL